MALRIRKSVGVAKGVHLNLSKSGVSVSQKVGPVTVNSRGRVSTHVAPGMTYVSSAHSGGDTSAQAQGVATKPSGPGPGLMRVVGVACIVLAVVWLILALAVRLWLLIFVVLFGAMAWRQMQQASRASRAEPVVMETTPDDSPIA